jgi:hypothetical protein
MAVTVSGVRAKPKISRQPDGRWCVTRPLFGFCTLPDRTFHNSWKAAVGSLTEAEDAHPGGGQFERGYANADAVASIPAWTPLEY